MRIRKFNDISDYVEIGDFSKKIEVNSPTYGKYYMTKVLTIDFIKSAENMMLGPVHDFYSKFREEIVTCKSISLESKRFGGKTGQDLNKFELYVPLKEDNTDWVDIRLNLNSKSLPVAYSKKWILEKINELL
jgi:hypothetical protein